MWLPFGCTLSWWALSASYTSVYPLQHAPPDCTVPSMASGFDDLLPATVLSVALSALHQVQKRSRTHRTMAQWEVALRAFDDAFEWEDSGEQDGPPVKRSRQVKERKDWSTSAWWLQLQDAALLDHATDAAKTFRTRFRVPHAFFLELVKLARGKRWFSRGEQDAAGRQGIPIELKVSTCLSINTHRNHRHELHAISSIRVVTAVLQQ